MSCEVELSSLDLRYESYRLRQSVPEQRLLADMAKSGIEEPLEGVAVEGARVLLNGFKRYRCAVKLNIQIVPYTELASDEVTAILNLLRVSNNKTLNILEQAAFVDELKNARKLSHAEIAGELSRSKSWVSMRLGLLSEMSPKVRELLFGGKFPVYSYMYLLKQFMRMNGVAAADIERFMEAVSGRQLSVREIEQLAHGYFRGPRSFRREIEQGNLALALEHLQHAAGYAKDCSEFERAVLRDLELTQKYMQRLMGKAADPRLTTRGFYAQCHLLSAGISSRLKAFAESLKELHARSTKA